MDDGIPAILADEDVQNAIDVSHPAEQIAFAKRLQWLNSAHDHQIVPAADWWTILLLLAGRGAGKTQIGRAHV